MSSTPIYQSRFEKLNCCILIPTYNNEKTLASVLQDLMLYTSNLVVVNDGSTDSTSQILQEFSAINIHHFEENQGKGEALKQGFKIAEALGYEYAVTIDSDGQHYPDDLDVFLGELENKKPGTEILLVGDRNMTQDGIPGKSTLGNKFSNFWFLVVTGINLTDTQSGYRLYPLKTINEIRLYTKKFELEIEVIVKAAWRKVKVKNISIKVFYEEENRVTHFRPFWDITRITLLYIWFVLVSFFYIHPRDTYNDFRRKGFKRFWKENIIKSDEPAHKKAAAIALGVFVGISPFWGFHTLLVFTLAAAFKLNKVVAFLFSNISIPPLIPVIVYASYQVGSFITGRGFRWELRPEDFDSATDLIQGFWQYIVGSFALAGVIALTLWAVFYFMFALTKQQQVVKP
ncbi:MAG: DUF2062 domain-containing protein [Salegentibacter sp.]|uniref:DUF2062 domain-containing protein n=1 Tax=Salegentibacter sp. TaxID=1903072 RepID=UPI0028707493|nr:DUF2062 domain-containing protein [Salegentibacter sp.]MDR9456314.1 DUF2062 domain-containing protein [Salegentibacter sp.]